MTEDASEAASVTSYTGTDASQSDPPTPVSIPETQDSQVPTVFERPFAIILDFNGTTTPGDLLKSSLHPYIKNNVDKYLKDNWSNKKLKQTIHKMRKELNTTKKDCPVKIKDSKAPVAEIQESVVEYINWYLDNGKDHVGASRLTKQMWSEAYEKGTLKTPVFDDVDKAMKQWKSKGIKIYIFSSNKVEAQKRFFRRSTKGDLLQYIDGHFDKSVGNKTSSASYVAIAQRIGQAASKMIYINDLPKEAKAATKAGMKAVLVVRPGNKEIPANYRKKWTTVESFLEIKIA